MLQTLILKRDMIHTWKIMKVTVSGKPIQTSLELWFRPLDLRGPWKVYSYPKKSLWCSNGNHKRPLSQGLELKFTRTFPSSCRCVFVTLFSCIFVFVLTVFTKLPLWFGSLSKSKVSLRGCWDSIHKYTGQSDTKNFSWTLLNNTPPTAPMSTLCHFSVYFRVRHESDTWHGGSTCASIQAH